MRNIILMRVSTDMQETESQRSEINKYIRENNIIVRKEDWIEEKDISGYSIAIDDRDGLNKIKEMAINKEVNRLIVFNLDRIGRQTEALSYISFLNQLGVKILSVTEGEIDANNINNQLLTYIKLWQSQNESIKTGLRVKAGLQAKNERGGYSGGNINYGYKYNTYTKEQEIDLEEAEIVKYIFNRFLEVGSNTIVQELNKKGIKKRDVKWRSASVTSMIKNKIYIGYKQYNTLKKSDDNRLNKKYIKCNDEIKYQEFNESLKIIDEDLFYKVQQVVEERNIIKDRTTRDTTRSEQLLSGFIYHKCLDGEIKKLYVDYSYRKNGGKTPMYRCVYCKEQSFAIQKTFGAKKINEIVEEKVFDELDKLDFKELESKIKEYKSGKIKIINKALNDIDKDIKRQLEIKSKATKELELIFLGESTLTKDIIVDMLNKSEDKLCELNKNKNSLNMELNIENNKITDVSNLLVQYSNFKEIYLKANILKKKSMLNSIIQRIVIDGEYVDIEFNLIRV